MVGRDAASKKTPGISGISNIEPRAELRVGRAHVDAVGASLALAFLRAPPVGLDRLLGAILAGGGNSTFDNDNDWSRACFKISDQN